MEFHDIVRHSKELLGNKRKGRPSRFLPRSTSTTVRCENKRVRAGFLGREGPSWSCAGGSGSRTSTSRPHLLRRQIFIIINTLSTRPVKGQQEWSAGHCEETWHVEKPINELSGSKPVLSRGHRSRDSTWIFNLYFLSLCMFVVLNFTFFVLLCFSI